MTSYFDELDSQKNALDHEFPGWHIWYVPWLGQPVVWYARSHPNLEADSRESLREWISEATSREQVSAAANAGAELVREGLGPGDRDGPLGPRLPERLAAVLAVV